MENHTLTWIHLSDLHMEPGNTFNHTVVFEALWRDIKSFIAEGIRPDFIAFTGDIAYHGTSQEYDLAEKEFFDPLLTAAEVGKDRLFIIPGNHDVNWTITNNIQSPTPTIQTEDDICKLLENSAMRELLLTPFSNYRDFVSKYLSPYQQLDDPAFAFSQSIKKSDLLISVVGLNSAWLSGFHHDTEGHVQDHGKLALGEWQVHGISRSDAHVRIALVHHPFNWFMEFDQTVAKDFLARRCFIVLRGHLHRPDVLKQSTLAGNLLVVPSGAIFDSRKSPNAYNIVKIDLGAGKGTIYFRRYSDRHEEWQKDIDSTGEARNGQVDFELPQLQNLTTIEVSDTETTTQPMLLGQRSSESVKETMISIVKEAADSESKVLRILGVAHKDLFGVNSFLWRAIEDLLTKDGRVELLFMDPVSEAAERRGEFETMSHRIEGDGVATSKVIESTLELARKWSRPYKNFIIRTYQQDASCFLLFNDRRMVLHPYFTSITGPSTDTMLVWHGNTTYEGGKQHFENLWGAKWLLFDLGNVLINFKHKKVSERLVTYMKTGSASLAERESLQEEVHDFLFRNQGGNRSRNDELDMGKKSLHDVYKELCSTFQFNISIDLFEQYWSEIFDQLKSDGIQCIRELRQMGLRIGICSNTNSAHWNYLMKRDKLANEVDACFLSFELQAKKPARYFFSKIAQHTRRPMPDHLLIDDREENIRGAIEAGMEAKVFESFDKIIEFVQSKGWDCL